MLTGLCLSEHGAHESRNRKVGEIEFKVKDTLVNDLRKRSYKSYLYTANAFLTEMFGFNDFDYIYFNSNVPIKYFSDRTSYDILQRIKKQISENLFSYI
jgi:hypothetical protein